MLSSLINCLCFYYDSHVPVPFLFPGNKNLETPVSADQMSVSASSIMALLPVPMLISEDHSGGLSSSNACLLLAGGGI